MKFFNIQKPVAAQSYKVLAKSLVEIEANLAKSGPFFLGKFSHIDINLMCCFHRLTDVKLDKLLDSENLPHLSKYWKLLKSRESYKTGILNFLGDKEYGDIKSVFGKEDSMHLNPLIRMIKNYEN
jgi:glutathione S-transferase